ncbi:hypothetical protein GCM10019016_083600 [Streptomyces prasinosporus]|uniref:Uncharacterized protein n=1 Tax=Streptomyces prasinosporus TaxID=68256 RepID=A0ABP6U3J1_9ACTN
MGVVGIACAVRWRTATDWTDYDWTAGARGPAAAALHMALDELLTAEVAAGRRPPTLRVWRVGLPRRDHRQLVHASLRNE